MIAADVALIDLEPEGFARICTLASRAEGAPLHTVSVMHDAGTVVLAHDSSGVAVDSRVSEPFDDPQRRAAELRRITGAQRVVLYDRTLTDQLSRRIVEIARPQTTQLEAFWANHDAFWSAAAIAVDPRPTVSSWGTLPARLAPLGDDWWALLGLYEAEACVATLLAHSAGGKVDVVTSLDHLGTAIPRPPRAAAHHLLEEAGRLGRVELALVCDIDDFAAALLEPDPPAAMAAISDTGRAIVARNVHLLSGGT